MNSIEMIEAHGKLWELLVDHDPPEAFHPHDTPANTARKLKERVDHLRAVMEAVDFYAETLALDCVSIGIPKPLFTDPIVSRRAALLKMRELLEAWRVPVP